MSADIEEKRRVMGYKEIKGDIFTEDMSYKFVQCISADLAMGKGIAVGYNEHFNAKNLMLTAYSNTLISEWDLTLPPKRGMCKYTPPVLNLVTKRRYWEKPTLETMKNALWELRALCTHYGIDKIAMPKIGCGLDRLKWEDVKKLIEQVFTDSEIEIHVWEL